MLADGGQGGQLPVEPRDQTMGLRRVVAIPSGAALAVTPRHRVDHALRPHVAPALVDAAAEVRCGQSPGPSGYLQRPQGQWGRDSGGTLGPYLKSGRKGEVSVVGVPHVGRRHHGGVALVENLKVDAWGEAPLRGRAFWKGVALVVTLRVDGVDDGLEGGLAKRAHRVHLGPLQKACEAELVATGVRVRHVLHFAKAYRTGFRRFGPIRRPGPRDRRRSARFTTIRQEFRRPVRAVHRVRPRPAQLDRDHRIFSGDEKEFSRIRVENPVSLIKARSGRDLADNFNKLRFSCEV